MTDVLVECIECDCVHINISRHTVEPCPCNCPGAIVLSGRDVPLLPEKNTGGDQ